MARMPQKQEIRQGVTRKSASPAKEGVRKPFNDSAPQPSAADIEEMMQAASAGFLGRVCIFLEIYPGYADVRDSDGGNTALYRAAAGDHESCARALLDGGAKLDLRMAEQVTPLMQAARAGSEKVARLLVERGAKLDLQDEDGNTALMLAAAAGYEDIVQLLLDAGADASIPDNDSRPAIEVARHYGREKVADVIETTFSKRAQMRAEAEENRKKDGSEDVLNKIKAYIPGSSGVFVKKTPKPPQA